MAESFEDVGKKEKQKWSEDFPEGMRVRVRGTRGQGTVVPKPEDQPDCFFPWHVPVRWDRNPRFVTAVPWVDLEKVVEEESEAV